MGHSWSGIKKRLEKDLIAPSLVGRVKYFITKYREAHDDEARFAIIVDGEEVLKANIFDFYKSYNPLLSITKEKLNVPDREYIGDEILFHKENREVENNVEETLLNQGVFPVYSFTDAVTEYLNQSIEKSLCSDNPLTRILAIFDRRVGKRTLNKISLTLGEQPEWVQIFYKLRLDAEHISYNSSQN
jgi:hypothetical protein